MSAWKMIYPIVALTLQAQTPMPPPESVPLYRVTVVQSSAKAINYRYLKSSTKIDFKGTVLAPSASGMAKVSSEATTTHIKAEFEGLPLPTKFGPEYLTYVLWGVSPEGRASNLGEILLKDGKGKLHATESLQAFGLVVTAEPYFGVSQPSDVVVMENAVRKDTQGKVELIDAKFDLLKRGHFHMDATPGAAVAMDKKTPFAVYQARNAVAIAKASGAHTYAADAYGKAERLLAQSESPKGSQKEKIRAAREAIQSAEDARLIAVKRQEAEHIETMRRLDQAKLDRAKDEAAMAKNEATMAKNEAALSAEAQANADLSRKAALKENSNLKDEAVLANAALANAENSRKAAVKENSNLREQLLVQLNAILQTHATARGLIVNMSGVTFKTGSSTLLPVGREKLAKIAGLILAHPGLKLESEGHTDNIGSDDINQKLSEQRAQAARDFLVVQGVSPGAIVSRGFGKGSPIDSNDTAEGRQNNRRVELVVSGTGITGEPVGTN